MSQHYSDPSREPEPHALPDVEVFHLSHAEAMRINRDNGRADTDSDGWITEGWYYCYCLPGCLPDSEPYGPYDTEQDAINAMRDDSDTICNED